MNRYEFKSLINDPCVFRKEVLEDTLLILKRNSAEETAVIEKAFLNGIKNPKEHSNPSACEYFWVECSSEEADEIASHLFDAEAMAVPPSGETTPEASHLAHLVDIWTDFRDWIDGGGDTSLKNIRNV